jgi:hypothetical protein
MAVSGPGPLGNIIAADGLVVGDCREATDLLNRAA